MADIFTIPKTFRPRRVIMSGDMNTLTAAIKAAFDSMGSLAVSALGVSTPFEVGTATASYHAVTKAQLDASPASATAAAASETAAAASETAAAASETAAASSASAAATSASAAATSAVSAKGIERTYVDDAAYVVSTTQSYVVIMCLATTARSVTLPASPGDGQIVRVLDCKWRADQYNITVSRNGKTIQNSASDLVIDMPGVDLTLQYSSSEDDWVVAELSECVERA